MEFPQHKAGLALEHNDHLNVYETVEGYLARGDADFYQFKNDEQKERCIASNELWTLQWYPETPVGFHAVAAPTLNELLEWARDYDGARFG